MMKSKFGLAILLVTLLLAASFFAGCELFVTPTTAPPKTATPSPTATPEPTPSPVPTPTPTPRPVIPIKGILPGKAPGGLDAVMEAVNARLAAELYVKLELGWLPADKYGDGIEAAMAAGDKPDFFWCDSQKLSAYVGKGLVAPVDGPLAEFGQDILKNIDGTLFDTMKIAGKLMGIPSAGNMPLSDTDHIFTVRQDLVQGYGLKNPDSIDSLEQFFKAVAENDTNLTPLCSLNAAEIIMKAFGPEEILGGTNGSVAYTLNADGTVTCLKIQDAASYKGAVAKVREWYLKGWIAKDILTVKDTGAALTNGTVAAADGSALAALTLQAAAADKAPGAVLADQSISGTAKVISGNGGSALCLSSASGHPGEVVQLWNWVYASQENYSLICYGVEGTDYSLKDGRIAMLQSGYSAFPSWIFANANYKLYAPGISDEYIDSVKHWNDGAALSPLIGFSFDPAPVKDEMAKVKTVVGNYVPLLNTGSGNTDELLAEFGAKLTEAGQDKIVAEAQTQINAFLSK